MFSELENFRRRSKKNFFFRHRRTGCCFSLFVKRQAQSTKIFHQKIDFFPHQAMTLPLHFLTHYQIWHNQFANCFVFCPQKFIFTSSKSVKRATCAIIFARKCAMKWSGWNCNFPAIVIIWNIMSADFRVATKSLDFHLRPSHAHTHTQIMHGNKNKYGSYHINYHEFVGTVYANGALIIIFSGKKRAWTGWEMSLSLTAVFSVHGMILFLTEIFRYKFSSHLNMNGFVLWSNSAICFVVGVAYAGPTLFKWRLSVWCELYVWWSSLRCTDDARPITLLSTLWTEIVFGIQKGKKSF